MNAMSGLGLLKSLAYHGVLFCKIAVMYQTLCSFVYGFSTKVHHIAIVFHVQIFVFGLALQ
jgi:hypothetical protein